MFFSDGAYFENHGNVAEYVRKLPYVCYFVKKVKETGILIDKPKCEKPKKSAYTREYCCCGR